ncbi:MAG TPA: methyltransferase domain-containing protein [Candidatus Limnocylindrales bacterium]|nr:methyltransferase domain-containing protein [Candidatus Limnocylindrales bacterium]
MKRVVVEELLDSDAGTPAEVAGSLKDLRMFNSVFGGVHTMSSLLRRVAHKRGLKQISWVDVAGGEGYVATRTQRSLARSGVSSQPVIVDRAPTHLGNTHPAVCGDALALPFRDYSFDAVGCSLFMHHLEPAEIVRFVREGLRVARHAFLIQDLQRHPLHLALGYLGMPFYRSRITRHDAVASVRRAYTVEEVRKILAPVASAENIEIRKFFLFRMGVIVWKLPNMI